MKRIILVVALVLVLIGAKLASGFGMVVHDPISYANALLMLAQIINNYEKLKEQYDLQAWEASVLPVDMGTAYRVPGVPWYELALPSDRFGRLSPWAQAVNTASPAWDAEAAELNVQAMRLARGAEEKARHTSTIGESIRSFRWR